MENTITLKDLRIKIYEKILTTGKTRFQVHNCSMCEYPCGYIILKGQVYYDSGCHCVMHANDYQVRDWDDIYNLYSMQSEKGKETLLNDWFGEKE